MPLLAFGTGEGLLGYGICVPCSKRLPGVRDAFSEAFGVKNRRFRYGRDIRCQKRLPVVRDAFSEALGAQKQASTVRDRYSVPETPSYGTEYACRAKKGFLRYATRFQKPSVLKIGFSGTE